jgi:hypothetical protein
MVDGESTRSTSMASAELLSWPGIVPACAVESQLSAVSKFPSGTESGGPLLRA